MPKMEYEWRASFKETMMVIRKGRFTKVSTTMRTNLIANASYWKRQKSFDISFNAKPTMSAGTVYSSQGSEKLMMKYTVISPDGSTKYIREISTPTAERTNKLVSW